MALNLIMLGPPGAGKGTQAERLARDRGLPKISTGDILREAVEAGTDLGRRVEDVMRRGDLVSDEVVTAIARERLNKPDTRGGFVLDGFPRTVWQAQALDEMMAGRDPLVIIHFSVPEAEIVRRLGARLVCGTCGTNATGSSLDPGGSDAQRCRRCGGALVQRADDQAGIVLERLKVYHRQTEPLIEYYRGRSTFREVNGARTLDQVAADLAAAVDQAYRLANSTAGGVRS
jgi:adenylate kinase